MGTAPPAAIRAATVDSSLPRAKATFHATLPAIAFLAGLPAGVVFIGAVGVIMAVSVVFGPRYSLFGRLFVGVIRPRLKIGPGKLEDAAPHRFAEAVGAAFLIASAAALALGATFVGWSLALVVVALAALNALAGICVGCQMYLLFKTTLARGAS